MKRLSDRAFDLVVEEINRCYRTTANAHMSQDKTVERMILLARLEALRDRDGKSLTSAQLWEEVCDIFPQIDPDVLKQAGHRTVNTGTTLLGTAIGTGAASIGATAVLLAMNLDTGAVADFRNFSTESASPKVIEASTRTQASHHAHTVETARAFGWQAALKGKNPPHSAQHWGETAALWQQAIELLDQVPRHDGRYTFAQAKKVEYQDYLQQIQARQLAAQNLASQKTPTPKFSQPATAKAPSITKAPSISQPPNPVTAIAQPPQVSATQTQPPQEDFLATAKGYGWQAAIASQNAPHPEKKWARISRQWQLALQTLNKIEPQHPSYAEAQQVKVQYEKNLAAIRQRYREEQDANQRVQSLQTALLELESSQRGTSKRRQMQAMVNRLNTIPANTVAYRRAQQLIAATNARIQAIPTSTTQATATVNDRN